MIIKYLFCGFLLGICTYLCAASDDFNYYVYAQQWPQSICIDENMTHEHTCKIASNVTTWTIHGLWPTKSGIHGPTFCNNTQKFDISKVQTILPLMIKYWPNLYTDTPLADFWEHEWSKHGTCAEIQPQLNSELKYFTAGLKLNRKWDILSILKGAGIIPDPKKPYQYTDVLQSLKHALGNQPSIQCINDKESKTQYIGQIEFCINKKLTATIPCEKGSLNLKSPFSNSGHIAPCHGTEPIVFPPIQH